jgi:hypothetical protein
VRLLSDKPVYEARRLGSLGVIDWKDMDTGHGLESLKYRLRILLIDRGVAHDHPLCRATSVEENYDQNN